MIFLHFLSSFGGVPSWKRGTPFGLGEIVFLALFLGF